MKQLAAALKKLDNHQKRFVYYYYCKRMTLYEIADLWGQKYRALKYLSCKVLEDLRGNMKFK